MIIVTGASRGIGRLVFEHYLARGELVRGTYHQTPPSEMTGNLSQVDVGDSSSVASWIDSISTEMEQITLVNCAGINYNSVAHRADCNKWNDVIRVNLIGSFNLIHALLPHMRAEGYGRIISLSSVVAQIGVPGTSAYAASKAGLWGMTRSIAAENAKAGITANCINLGYFDIGMINEVPEPILANLRDKIPIGNLGQPEEILRCIDYIRQADYLTGAAIDLNGGLFSNG